MNISLAEYRSVWKFTVRWLFWGAVVGVLASLAVSVFVLLLTIVTTIRTANLWLIALLPLAGLLSAWLYRVIGKENEKGNNLIIDEVLEFKGRVRFLMAPLILVATLITHLFGGSAGREGTAVQMSGAIAAKFARLLKFTARDAQLLMMAGISGGFSAVFGTPVAGAIFGMEVIARGEIKFASAIACVSSALAAYLLSSHLAPVHENYHVLAFPSLGLIVLGKVLLLAVPFAFASIIFSELTHFFARKSSEWIKVDYLRPACGGLLVLVLFLLVRDPNYLGLSIPFLERTLNGESMPIYAFVLKILFTSLTLGFGFKGGEVTPLFVIGALLGSALAPLLSLPITVGAALGFVSVFAAASKTPIASTIMGIEIFGASYAAPLVFLNFVGYALAGHSGIYSAQRRAHFGFETDDVPLAHIDSPISRF